VNIKQVKAKLENATESRKTVENTTSTTAEMANLKRRKRLRPSLYFATTQVASNRQSSAESTTITFNTIY